MNITNYTERLRLRNIYHQNGSYFVGKTIPSIETHGSRIVCSEIGSVNTVNGDTRIVSSEAGLIHTHNGKTSVIDSRSKKVRCMNGDAAICAGSKVKEFEVMNGNAVISKSNVEDVDFYNTKKARIKNAIVYNDVSIHNCEDLDINYANIFGKLKVNAVENINISNSLLGKIYGNDSFIKLAGTVSTETVFVKSGKLDLEEGDNKLKNLIINNKSDKSTLFILPEGNVVSGFVKFTNKCSDNIVEVKRGAVFNGKVINGTVKYQTIFEFLKENTAKILKENATKILKRIHI